MSGLKEKITINDIARLAKVSKKTVSRVINNSPKVREQTRQKVLAIIRQHGYKPHPQARALALRRSFLIAMIYDHPSPQYVVNMQRAILDELDDTGLQLITRPCDRNEADFYERMQDFVDHTKISGAILPPSVSEDQQLVDLLTASGCRCIRIAPVVTAIFAGNDEMAIGVYQAARNAGIDIPGDLSVVGFDDTPIASRVWPPLTTVCLPIREMGRAAASLLLLNRDAQKMRHYMSFTPEIVVRGSTAQPQNWPGASPTGLTSMPAPASRRAARWRKKPKRL